MGLAPGTTFGRYEIRGLLGKGGMGSVYRALHLDLQREVALKLLDAPLVIDGQTDDGAARFEREARAIARLDHPSVVRILDYGRGERHQYIAMQLLEGPTLGQQLRTTPQLAPSRAIQITRHLLGALAHAHASGVLHRDLKPENVVLTGLPAERSQTLLGFAPALGSGGHATTDAHPPGRAVLIDFGLAFLHDDAALTAKGACVGSPSYLAPERLDGVAPDARADLYAVGVMLYEMVAGVRPFTGDSIGEILLACRTQPARPLRAIRPEVSRGLEAFVVRAIAKDPARRFQTATAMLEALEQLVTAERQAIVRSATSLELRASGALDEIAASDDAAETCLELELAPPSAWSRLWSWLRFGKWRRRDLVDSGAVR